MPRTVLSIALPMAAFPALFLLAFFLPVPWEATLHPKWGWIVSTTGATIALVAAAGFLWPVLDHQWCFLTCASIAGLAIFAASWNLELALWGLSHGVRVALFLASFALLVLGAWQAIRIKTDDLPEERAIGRTEGRVEGRREGYDQATLMDAMKDMTKVMSMGALKDMAKVLNKDAKRAAAKATHKDMPKGAQRGHDEGYAEGYVKGRADGVDDIQETRPPASFDPWRVLGLQPGATQTAIRRAFREQSEKNHPDKAAHLSEPIQALADRQMRDINRAYAMLRKR